MTDPTFPVTGGVDTHKDTHVAAVLNPVGVVLGTSEFPVTPAGYRRLLVWMRDFGELTEVGVEGTGAWGAGLARHLTGHGVRVIEVQRPNRQYRRRHGKSDTADAIGAARAVQSGEASGTPKTADGRVEAIRLLFVARRSAMKARTQAANQIHAVVTTAPAELRSDLAGLNTKRLVTRCARFHTTPATTPLGAARRTLRLLARRWQSLTEEIKELDLELNNLTAQIAPSLRDLPSIGTQTAAVLLLAAGDNPDRLERERSFAALCGASPVDASSGRQRRHRLNRGGDRHANAALYMIVVSRLRWHQPTRDYMQRRLAEGRTKKEIIRCLKRYVARQAHQAILHDLARTEQLPPSLAA